MEFFFINSLRVAHRNALIVVFLFFLGFFKLINSANAQTPADLQLNRIDIFSNLDSKFPDSALSIQSPLNVNYLFLSNNLLLRSNIQNSSVNFRLEGIRKFPFASLGSQISKSNAINSDNPENQLSFMKGYYDFNLGGEMTPFLVAGFGGTSVNVRQLTISSISPVDSQDLALAYQLGGGLSFPISDNGTLLLGYKFFKIQDFTRDDLLGNPIQSGFENHQITIGLKTRF